MPNVTALYFDSALIAKFYLNEPGRDTVRELAARAGKVVSSAVAVAEVSAAFHRKFREGAAEADSHTAVQSQFAHDLKAGLWTLIPVTDVLLESVHRLFARLPPSVFLRSLDALHLLTAKSERFDQVYSNDRHLLAACPAVGLRGVNPVGSR